MRNIPDINSLLNHPQLSGKLKQNLLAKLIRQQINILKETSKDSLNLAVDKNERSLLTKKIITGVLKDVEKLTNYNIKRVINGSGVILNTNLGRSPIPQTVVEYLSQNLNAYLDLEVDIESGKRIERTHNAENLLKFLTDAQSCLIVNNNAAALTLIINTFSLNKDVIISRGELVEIGGNFRLPDIIEASGGILKEIGSTNKTKITDYEKALNNETGLILKCHKSNFKVLGFTQDVDLLSINQLKRKIPLVYDLGSGIFEGYLDVKQTMPINDFIINAKMLQHLDLLCFSADKLLGSLQAGIILGKEKYINKLRINPLYRSLRLDKVSIMILEKCLQLYLKQESFDEFPGLKVLNIDKTNLKSTVQNFINWLKPEINSLILRPIETQAILGGGSISDLKLDSYGLIIESMKNLTANSLNKFFRLSKPAIIGQIQHNQYIIDFATLLNDDLTYLAKAIKELDLS